MNHLDLFSGIGGFALAADMVWGGTVNHTFVEHDPFCQAVLRKHWPDADIHGDIRTFIAQARKGDNDNQRRGRSSRKTERVDLLTGGFPCQPFSQAGRRRGTADDRYLWPAMRDAVALFKPRAVIAENVAGLVTWNHGVVLETVCADLETEGYEVRPFVIPACALGAPHRRDRVWIVAHAFDDRPGIKKQGIDGATESLSSQYWSKDCSSGKLARATGGGSSHRHEPWEADWTEVAARFCGMDDGIPDELDRAPRLKALGNAIVPQVAAVIMRSIVIRHAS